MLRVTSFSWIVPPRLQNSIRLQYFLKTGLFREQRIFQNMIYVFVWVLLRPPTPGLHHTYQRNIRNIICYFCQTPLPFRISSENWIMNKCDEIIDAFFVSSWGILIFGWVLGRPCLENIFAEEFPSKVVGNAATQPWQKNNRMRLCHLYRAMITALSSPWLPDDQRNMPALSL